MLVFSYDGNAARLQDEQNHINVIQTYNPYNNSPITDKDTALVWLRQHLLSMYNAAGISLSVSCEHKEEFKCGTEYKFYIKEDTGKLLGNYKISFIGDSKTIEEEMEFTDGEAVVSVKFPAPGVYNIDLENDFCIGTQKYKYVIDKSKQDLEKNNDGDSNQLVIVVE